MCNRMCNRIYLYIYYIYIYGYRNTANYSWYIIRCMYLQPATNGETKAGWKYKPQIYWGVHMFQPKRNGLIWLWRKLRVPIFTNGPTQLVSISVKPYVKPSTFSGQWFWAWPTDDFQRWIPSKKFHTKPEHGHLQEEHFMGKWFEKECNTLWLCQNSYWKWWFIVSFPIENGDFP